MKKLNLNIQMFGSTNKTPNYNLPQFVGTDKPTWLGDFNQAMSDIDTGMHANATNIESVETIAENASTSASQATQDVSALSSTVSTLSTNVSAVTQTANNAQSTATSALNTANTANGKADTNAGAISTIESDIEAINNSLDNNLNYSTSEVLIGKWLGENLYRKTVDIGNLPNATSKTVAHGISNLKEVVKIDGCCYDGNNYWFALPLVYKGGDSQYNAQVGVSATAIQISTSQNRSAYTGHVTIYYTKNTTQNNA